MLYQYVFDPCVEINQTRMTTIIKGSLNEVDVKTNINKIRMTTNTILMRHDIFVES